MVELWKSGSVRLKFQIQSAYDVLHSHLAATLPFFFSFSFRFNKKFHFSLSRRQNYLAAKVVVKAQNGDIWTTNTGNKCRSWFTFGQIRIQKNKQIQEKKYNCMKTFVKITVCSISLLSPAKAGTC